VFCVSERIFAFGAAEEFSDGSGRLEAGFGVSINFAWLGVVVKARNWDMIGRWKARRRRLIDDMLGMLTLYDLMLLLRIS